MDEPATIAVIFFTIGLVLLTVGFAARSTRAGIASMAIGIVFVLGTIAYYITAITAVGG